jgi:glycosyltransferase involved in cell wall biosynthesis
MDLSVIVCTYNRSHYLKSLLEGFSKQVLPQTFKWEIIVVDNNSTDDTKRVSEQINNSLHLPLRFLFEPRQGKSYALNTGIKEARGDIIAFTDDDIELEAKWISTIYNSFIKHNCDGLCGRISIKLPDKTPRWLTQELWGFLGYLDYGNTPFYITDQGIFGGNVAYTKEILQRVGSFNVTIGRLAHKMGGEDVEYGERVVRSGGRVVYEPHLLVHHIIEPWKLNRTYFLKLHYYEGIASSTLYNKPVGKTMCGIPRFLFPQFFRSIMNFLKNPSLRMQMNTFWYLGFMRDRIALSRNREA